jgi:serine/threonine-protein kinase RsbT
VSRPSRFPKALTVSPRAPCILPIASEDERLWASGEARKFAAELGFCPDDQARIAVCVAELASNAVKHGGGGRVELHEVILPAPGCRVRVEDHGPGIGAVDEALRDGFSEGRWLTGDVPWSERRGLGVGLGAVRRLMSDVRVLSSSSEGLIIEAVLWRKPSRSSVRRR